MQLVVVDPWLLLTGALIPDSRARRLLVLLYYGHEANLVRLYETGDRLPTPDTHQSGALEVGGPSYWQLVADAEDRAALLREKLTTAVPDDVCLALSRPMLAQLDGAAERAKVDPAAVRHRVLTAVAALAGIELEATRGWATWSRKPREIDERRAVLLATAVAVEGYLVVSDDPVLIEERETPIEYLDPRSGAGVTVVGLDQFVDRYLAMGPSFDEIPTALFDKRNLSAPP